MPEHTDEPFSGWTPEKDQGPEELQERLLKVLERSIPPDGMIGGPVSYVGDRLELHVGGVSISVPFESLTIVTRLMLAEKVAAVIQEKLSRNPRTEPVA